MSGLPAELPKAQISLPPFSHRIINIGKAHPADGELPLDPHGHQGQGDLGVPKAQLSVPVLSTKVAPGHISPAPGLLHPWPR